MITRFAAIVGTVGRFVRDVIGIRIEVRRYSDASVVSLTGQCFIGGQRCMFSIPNVEAEGSREAQRNAIPSGLWLAHFLVFSVCGTRTA